MSTERPTDTSEAGFERERARLTRIAAQVLGDAAEAQDVVQQAWLRLHSSLDSGATIENLPGWLTTVTTRLCMDRLRLRVPEPVDELDALDGTPTSSVGDPEHDGDPWHDVVLAEAVGTALHVVLDRLTPRERVAFVLHDTFAVDFEAIAELLDTNAAAARKLASRARAKLARPVPVPGAGEGAGAAAEVVDAFLIAARGGDLPRLLALLAPDVVVTADAAAIAAGTPTRLEGRETVAGFFDGAARGAFPVFVEDRPGLAWLQHGEAKVAFDLTVADGTVTRIVFRADPEVLAGVRRRPASS